MRFFTEINLSRYFDNSLVSLTVVTGSDDKEDEFLDSEHEEFWRMECERMDEIERRWFEVDLAEHNRRA